MGSVTARASPATRHMGAGGRQKLQRLREGQRLCLERLGIQDRACASLRLGPRAGRVRRAVGNARQRGHAAAPRGVELQEPAKWARGAAHARASGAAQIASPSSSARAAMGPRGAAVSAPSGHSCGVGRRAVLGRWRQRGPARGHLPLPSPNNSVREVSAGASRVATRMGGPRHEAWQAGRWGARIPGAVSRLAPGAGAAE